MSRFASLAPTPFDKLRANGGGEIQIQDPFVLSLSKHASPHSPTSANHAALRFAGYAALFGRRDAAGDVIRRGAFARTLAGRGDPLPLLWQHRTGLRIGRVEAIAEDARGLRVVAAIGNPDGAAALAVRRGAVTGLSFGYHVRAATRSAQGRELLDLELVEVSLVAFPMQHGARIHLVS